MIVFDEPAQESNLPQPQRTRKGRPSPTIAVLACVQALRRVGYSDQEIEDAFADHLEGADAGAAVAGRCRAQIIFAVPELTEEQRAEAKARFLAEHDVTRCPPGFAWGLGSISASLHAGSSRKPATKKQEARQALASLDFSDLDLDL